MTAQPTASWAGERLQVTTPVQCEYSVLLTAATTYNFPSGSGWRLDTPTVPSGSTVIQCPESPDTLQSGIDAQDPAKRQYRARVVAGASVNEDTSDSRSFDVLFTDKQLYQRAEEVHIRSIGWSANEQLQIQIDSPSIKNLKLFSTDHDGAALRADSTGTLDFRFVLPHGMNADGDIGSWFARILSTQGESGKPTGTDIQLFHVERTEALVEWQTQPKDTSRMGMTGAIFDLIYASSVGNSMHDADLCAAGGEPWMPCGPVRISSSDVAGGLVDVLVQQRTGPTFQDATAGTATYNQNTGRWSVSWFPDKDFNTLPTYRLATKAAEDRFKNPIPIVASDTFVVDTAVIEPDWTISSPVVERASSTLPLDAKVKLAYANGQPLAPADLGDEELEIVLVSQAGIAPGSGRIGTFTSQGTWAFSEVMLPPGTPLGEVRLQLRSPVELPVTEGRGGPNVLDTSKISDAFEVTRSRPELAINFYNGTDNPADSFLRGEQLTIEAEFSYGNGARVRHGDVFPPGGSGVGRAIARVVPNEDPTQIFELDLTFDSATETWGTTYFLKSTDPVGKWRVATLLSDQYGNSNVAERTATVGLVVTAGLSSNQAERGDEIVVTARLTLPGQTHALTGTVEATIKGPGDYVLAEGAALLPTASGTYEAEFQIPTDATLGTYSVTVKAENGKDAGLDGKTFLVEATGLGVRDLAVTDAVVARLEEAEVRFAVSFAGDQPGLGPDEVTPLVRVVGQDTDQQVTPIFDSSTGMWSAVFQPELTTALGSYHFEVSGEDVSGNPIEKSTAGAFDVGPAKISITDLKTDRTQYDRGQTMRVVANAHYADAPDVGLDDATIPVDVAAGDEVLGSITLKHNATTKRYEGTYTLQLSDPLSSPTKQYEVRVRHDTVSDGRGNVGPAAGTASPAFAVRVAIVSVEIIAPPEGEHVVTKDEVAMRFRLLASDGTPITGAIEGLRVDVRRGLGPIGNATVTAADDGYRASFPLVRGTAPGSDYVFAVHGTDAYGNTIRETASLDFVVEPVDKESPGLPMLAVLGLLGLLVRRRK